MVSLWLISDPQPPLGGCLLWLWLIDDFLPLHGLLSSTWPRLTVLPSFLVFQKLPPWWFHPHCHSHIQKRSQCSTLPAPDYRGRRGPGHMHSIRSSENIHVTMALKLSHYYYYELRPSSIFFVCCSARVDGRTRGLMFTGHGLWGHWARRWYALSPSLQFTISFERWNKFSIRSIDSGVRLTAWVQISALLLTSCVSLRKLPPIYISFPLC